MNKQKFSPEAPSTSNMNELASFFWRQLQEISALYTEENVREFLSWHTQSELANKVIDPQRFFRIIRDEKGNIIAYFESKQSGQEDMEDVQVIQWFFVKEEHRERWALKVLWKEFIEWCEANNYTIIWSYTALQNEVSKDVHRRLLDEIPTVQNLGWTDMWKYTKSLPLYSEWD